MRPPVDKSLFPRLTGISVRHRFFASRTSAPLQNPKSEMREIYRIRAWLAENEVDGAMITAKIDGDGSQIANYSSFRSSNLIF
jgi:hypothetical protein